MKVFLARACFLLVVSLCSQAQSSTQPPAAGQQPKQQQATPATTASAAQPEIDPVKAADIQRLLDVTGADNLATQMMTEMEKSIRPLMTNALPPGEYREKLIELFFAKFHSNAEPRFYRKLALPIYDKYYSDQEVKGLIEFYSTPLGQKVLSALPQLFSELQEAGRKWGEQEGREAMMQVLAEHPELKKALEDASKGPAQ